MRVSCWHCRWAFHQGRVVGGAWGQARLVAQPQRGNTLRLKKSFESHFGEVAFQLFVLCPQAGIQFEAKGDLN
ncbi:MAG: hypothetical protein IPN76_07205 [Saprospiraceae bacterium]|nr:hypothetical protein [Saprospiraceae bacterium]